MASPVTTTHPDYATLSPAWQRCRDTYAGGDAVKARGEEYLPKLDGHTAAEYAAYRMRADFYGAVQRTVDGLAGAVFRKPPTVLVPDGQKPHLEDVTSGGVPLEPFAKLLVEEGLLMGRAGVLVDLPGQVAADARPYWLLYTAEQITNWRTETRGGRQVLTLVVLKETTSAAKPGDVFSHEVKVQYRVLELVAGVGGDVYQVKVYTATKVGEKTDWSPQPPTIPTRRGEVLRVIPFVFISPDGIGPSGEKPPMLDLVDMNLSHYRSSADLERARFFVASPTPYICGFSQIQTTPNADTRQQEFRIGSAIAWTFQSPETKVGMLEVSGQGLPELRNALVDKQELMAVLGARLLEAQKADAEAAATVKLRHAGDESVLKKLTMAIDLALTQVLRWHVWWSGVESDNDQVKLTLNADVFNVVASSDLVTKLLLAVQAGRMSHATFYWNLQRAELTRPGVTFEEEELQIDVDEAADPALPVPAAFAERTEAAKRGDVPPPADGEGPNDITEDEDEDAA